MAAELLMGNQAAALGAIRAGVGVVAGYPGTPSTETLETVAARNPGDIYVEWSTNEKAALEVAAGAALSGVRSLVTMKQVGLNVASDPLMSLAYIGVKAGMVVLAADDPGPISSVQIAGREHLPVQIFGRQTGHIAGAGENSVESVKKAAAEFLGIPLPESSPAEPPALPVRPPVLCAGCPHRASFYAVKQAMKGQKAVFCGDIGCYTLGNAMPLDMVDTCLCMGAGITMAQGIRRSVPDAKTFAFVGDSTFFASGITGVVNAVYNETDMTLIVLDNSTTAMTGHQPHPGTGKTMMGEITEKISIPKVLEAIGVRHIEQVDPLKLEEAVAAVKRAAAVKGVSAVIFQSPCIAVVKPGKALTVDAAKCVGCRKCINELGCPALSLDGKKVRIEPSMCTGCGLCAQVCPVLAIGKKE